jgi:hypothetical protein
MTYQSFLSLQREREPEGRAFPQLALDADVAAMLFNDRPTERTDTQHKKVTSKRKIPARSLLAGISFISPNAVKNPLPGDAQKGAPGGTGPDR